MGVYSENKQLNLLRALLPIRAPASTNVSIPIGQPDDDVKLFESDVSQDRLEQLGSLKFVIVTLCTLYKLNETRNRINASVKWTAKKLILI